MTEETHVVLNNQKNTNLKSMFLNYKKTIISGFVILLIILFGYFFYIDFKKNTRIEISEKYSSAIINYNKNNTLASISEMKKIISTKDSTYSPLALYFILDNNLLNDKDEINKYFDILINETNLNEEIKNLIIYKKALYNSDSASENNLLKILKPILNSESIWKSHSLYLMSEYFLSKNEKEKSKEFLIQIIELENSNPSIKAEAQKMINRYFSG